MGFYKEGDKSEGICPSCNTIVYTVFKEIEGHLASYCDICDTVVGIPQQDFGPHHAPKKRNEAKMSLKMRKLLPGDVLIEDGDLYRILEVRPFVNGQDGFSKRPRIWLKLESVKDGSIKIYHNYLNFAVVLGNKDFKY